MNHEEEEKPASLSHKLRNTLLAVSAIGASLMSVSVFAWTAQAATITAELTGGGTGATATSGVSGDMQTVGVATITIAIVPYAFSRLRSMLR
jgi:hypothetical protein